MVSHYGGSNETRRMYWNESGSPVAAHAVYYENQLVWRPRISAVGDWRVTSTTTTTPGTTTYNWSVSWRHSYVQPAIPATDDRVITSTTQTRSRFPYTNDRAVAAADLAQEIPLAVAQPDGMPYTDVHVTSYVSVPAGQGGMGPPYGWHISWYYSYTVPGTPGTPEQTVYSNTMSASGTASTQSAAQTALNAAVTSPSSPYTSTETVSSSITSSTTPGSSYTTYTARWTAPTGDFTQYRIERDDATDIIITNTDATAQGFGGTNYRARIRAENTDVSPPILGVWSPYNRD